MVEPASKMAGHYAFHPMKKKLEKSVRVSIAADITRVGV